MQFEWFICQRYLKAKRKQGFISLITIISVAGVAVGVMAMIIVLGVMTGFTDGFRDKILGINSHIVVQKFGTSINNYGDIRKKILAVPGVKAVTPYIYSQTMITGRSGGTGAILRGIDPITTPSVLNIEKHLQQGSLADLETDTTAKTNHVPSIIIGGELAKQLHVRMHDKIRLMLPSGPLTPMGIIPKMMAARVVGIFDTGMYEYDSSLVYVALATAQKFLDMDDTVHGLEIKVNDLYQAKEIGRKIEDKLGVSYIAKDWMRTNRNLFSALQLEKTSLSIIVALIVLVAAFNIVSTLIMVVMEKNKDIAILKSMGATSRNIMRIFIYEGLIIGLSGTVIGILSGLGICELLSHYQFIKLPDVYPLSTLPVKVLPMDVTMIALAAVFITFAATLYPSWQAAKVEPAAALRFEA